MLLRCLVCLFFFFNDTATTEIYTLSLHDALPISPCQCSITARGPSPASAGSPRSEEHTSELQSRQYIVCRLLLEKKKHKVQKLSLTIKDTEKSKTKIVHNTS